MVRRLLSVALALLAVGTSWTAAVAGQNRGGGGKKSDNPSLIIVFRDAAGDLVRSDGLGPYIDGEEGIDWAVFGDNGQVQLGLTVPKGKQVVATRHLRINLLPSARDQDADIPGTDGEAPWVGEQDVVAFFHAFADDGTGRNMEGGVRAVVNWTWLRFPIFGTSKSPLEGWKLSYSDDRLRTGGLGVGFATVSCVHWEGAECVAWRIDKETYKAPNEVNRAALVGGGTHEAPDAGEWILPFAFAVCLRDAPTFATPDPGATCKNIVFPGS